MKQETNSRGPSVWASSKRPNRGFTLVEVVLVAAIITVLAIVIFPSLTSRRSYEDLNATTKKIMALLREAQSRSISQASSTSWGVHFENATTTSPFYALFSSSYSTSTTVGYYRLPPKVTYAPSLAQGSSTDVTFAQITGLPSASSTSIILQLSPGGSVAANSIITVKSNGPITYLQSTDISGLIGYWPLDGGTSGSIANNTTTGFEDVSGNSNNATAKNANGTGMAWVSGKAGGAVSFDGTDDYAEALASADFLGSGDSVTISVWVKPGSSQKQYADIFDYDHAAVGAYGNFVVQQNSTDLNLFYFAFTYDGTNWDGIPKTAQLTTNSWQNFTIVKSGTSLDHYVNGVKQGTTLTVQSNIYNRIRKFRIGDIIEPTLDRNFNGSIDDVRIYNRALSATEVLNLYNSY